MVERRVRRGEVRRRKGREADDGRCAFIRSRPAGMEDGQVEVGGGKKERGSRLTPCWRRRFARQGLRTLALTLYSPSELICHTHREK